MLKQRVRTALIMFFVFVGMVFFASERVWFAGIGLLTLIPFIEFGAMIGLAPLPAEYFAWLALTIVLYMALVTVLKKLYVRHYGELL